MASRPRSTLVGALVWLVLDVAAASAEPRSKTLRPATADPNAPIEIPPEVQEEAVKTTGGGYCYLGSHPVDQSSAAGPAWHDDHGKHIHFYAPIDLRLFVRRGDCYTFKGDPTDFGARTTTHGFYGAHPLLPAWGNGWCFMQGGHQHPFAPWSRSFVRIGPWNYWDGEYDPVFWTYWPYWSHYHQSLYPQYYGGGRYLRDRRVAPAIDEPRAPDLDGDGVADWNYGAPTWPPPSGLGVRLPPGAHVPADARPGRPLPAPPPAPGDPFAVPVAPRDATGPRRARAGAAGVRTTVVGRHAAGAGVGADDAARSRRRGYGCPGCARPLDADAAVGARGRRTRQRLRIPPALTAGSSAGVKAPM